MAWGLFPVLFLQSGLTLAEVGWVAAAYPAVWGIAQLATGPLSDGWGRKRLIAGGMALQAAAIAVVALGHSLAAFAAGSVLLGIGTAMVYPTLMAAIADVAHASWRARAIGVYRLWRDLGYVAGALAAGGLADAFGLRSAAGWVAGITFISAVVVAVRMSETLQSAGPRPRPSAEMPTLAPPIGGRLPLRADTPPGPGVRSRHRDRHRHRPARHGREEPGGIAADGVRPVDRHDPGGPGPPSRRTVRRCGRTRLTVPRRQLRLGDGELRVVPSPTRRRRPEGDDPGPEEGRTVDGDQLGGR
jgi:hypothetical protein